MTDFNALSMISLLPKLMSIGPAVNTAIHTKVSFKSITALVTDPAVVSVFQQLGESLFPKVAPQLKIVAAIVTAYSPDRTTWLQNAVNALLPASATKIAVDGHYGPETRAAIEVLQNQLGVHVDGWAGDVTSAAIQLALTKLG